MGFGKTHGGIGRCSLWEAQGLGPSSSAFLRFFRDLEEDDHVVIGAVQQGVAELAGSSVYGGTCTIWESHTWDFSFVGKVLGDSERQNHYVPPSYLLRFKVFLSLVPGLFSFHRYRVGVSHSNH